MTVISVREVSPLPGGAEEAEERCKQAAAIMTKHGANAWVARVVAGDLANHIQVLVRICLDES